MDILATIVVAVFWGLALLHVYWALGGRIGSLSVLPEVDGKPVFLPSTMGTMAVAVALIGAGFCIAVATGLFLGFPTATEKGWAREVASWISRGVALVLLARGIGDFRLVGLFKRVRGTRFSALDDRFYSPFCLVLALSVCAISW